MKKFLADLIKRFTSRKFLLTLGTALIFIANQQWNELLALIVAYTGFEGGADIVERYRNVTPDLSKVDTTQLSQLYNDAVDEGVIEPGHTPAL